MTDLNELVAEERTEFGKGASRRERREGKIPAVLYGHGIDPRHLLLPGHETFLVIKNNPNAVVSLKLGKEEEMALVKAVSRHPVRREIQHVDLLLVKKGEKVDVEVPLVVVGEAAAGAQYALEQFQLLVKAPATAIPESVEIDITGLEIGAVVRAGDLKLPKGVSSDVAADADILSIQEIREAVVAEGSSAGAAAEEAAGE